MFFTAMLIDALHSTVEDQEKPFNGVGRNFATRIFFSFVVDRLVVGENLAGSFLLIGLVAHDSATPCRAMNRSGSIPLFRLLLLRVFSETELKKMI
jgi:hypothetical protein